MENPVNDIFLGEITSHWAKHQGVTCRYEKSTASTNDLAKEEAFGVALAEDLKVYLTDHQTHGRGRGGNTWSEGRRGSALLSSWSYLQNVAPQPILTPRVGLALLRSVKTIWPFLPWSLKAPNDLYLGDHKVAGLLVETLSQGDEYRLIIGLGFNLLDAPDEVETATCLMDELPTGVPLLGDDWAAWLDRWLFELTDAVAKPADPLTTTEQASLKAALNDFPGLSEPILVVTADGSLETKTGVKNWMEL